MGKSSVFQTGCIALDTKRKQLSPPWMITTDRYAYQPSIYTIIVIIMSLLSPLTQSILSDKNFDIEFSGYLTNHAKHGIVALGRLGASDERIQEWWDAYTTLTPYHLKLDRTTDAAWANKPCSAQEFAAWKGQKKKWPAMCAFLQQELEQAHHGDTTKLVQMYAPDLLDGMAGALTHGIIHLGWGLDAANPWMIVEGLAYLNFCHVGVDPHKIKENAVQESMPMESLQRISHIWKDQDLQQTWVQATKDKYDESFHPELVVAGFQWQLAKVMQDAHSVATDLPSWLTDLPLDQLWESLYRTVVYIYLATRTNSESEVHGNFLVLHAITSLWGLEHVCRVIGNDTITRKALDYYYTMVICLLAASAGGIPEYLLVEKMVQEFPVDATDSTDFDWTPITTAGIAEEEEHNIKLVYVCNELWKRYGKWQAFSEAAKSFTLTPNIGPKATSFKS